MRGSCSSATENASFCRQPRGIERTERSPAACRKPRRDSIASVRSRIWRSREIVDAAVQPDVLRHREILVEREPLAHVADVSLDGFALGVDVVAGDGRLAAGRRRADPVSIRIAVVFPAPFAPRKPKTSPARTSNVMRSHGGEAPELAGQIPCDDRLASPLMLRAPPRLPPMRAMNVSSTVGGVGSTRDDLPKPRRFEERAKLRRCAGGRHVRCACR